MPRSRVSIAFRLLKRLVGRRWNSKTSAVRKVSIAFRLLKRLVAVLLRKAPRKEGVMGLNCLSAVEAIGSRSGFTGWT